MLKIRLQRIGKKKQAHYKVVVMEHTRKTTGKYLELLGWYNPHTSEIEVNEERLNHHLSNGAQMSATINNLLVTRGIVKGEKVTSWKPKKRPKKEETTETPKVKEKPVEEPKVEETSAKEIAAEEVKKEESKEKVEKKE